MIYVSEDGRIFYNEDALNGQDKSQFVAVDDLPDIPHVEGKIGYRVANLKNGTIEFIYFDVPIIPEPIVPPTEEQKTEAIEEAILNILEVM